MFLGRGGRRLQGLWLWERGGGGLQLDSECDLVWIRVYFNDLVFMVIGLKSRVREGIEVPYFTVSLSSFLASAPAH